MPKNVLEYRCLLISPGDVRAERESLTELIGGWNAQIGQALGARVELVKWESHATPDMSGHPQAVINAQLLQDCDFAVAVFWTRLGTPTAEYESGSIEEIYRLLEKGAHVLVYFNTSPIPQEALSDDQFGRLQEVKKRFEREGLLGRYSDIANLREQVQLHLTSVVAELLAKDRSDVSRVLPQTVGVSKPDVRVKTNIALTPGVGGGVRKILSVKVENHSPQLFFMGNINLKMRDGMLFFAPRDSITGEYQTRRELHPGEAFTFNIAPDVIEGQVNPEDLVCATVADDIGRVYESSESDFRLAIHVFFNDEC